MSAYTHTHTFTLSTYTNTEYSYNFAFVCQYRVHTHARFICCLLVWERKAKKDSLSSTIPRGNILLCLSLIHTQIFAKAYSNQPKIWTIPWLVASYISLSPEKCVFSHWYRGNTSGFSCDTVKIHSAFSDSVPGKHFRVWWCPMEKDLQKSPG